MYKIPDMLAALSYILPWSKGRAARAASPVTNNLLQYLLDNPATNKGLPAFTHLLGGGK